MAEWLKAVDSKSIRGPKSPLGGSNPSLSANFFKSHLNQIYLRNSGSIEEMPCNGQWQVHKPREYLQISYSHEGVSLWQS